MNEVRRHLAELAEEALAEGFDRVELEREIREGVEGWRLLVGREKGSAAEKFIVGMALAVEGLSYTAELRTLIQGWARAGIPRVDRVDRRDEERAPLSDLAFLLRVVNGGGNSRLVSFLEQLLVGPLVTVDALARAVRAAVAADEPT